MSRYPAERHNDEFRKLFDEFRRLYDYPVGVAQVRVAEALGVSVDTVKQWMKPTTTKNAIACPKYRVEAFKIILGVKLRDLSDSQRERVMEILRYMGPPGGK